MLEGDPHPLRRSMSHNQLPENGEWVWKKHGGGGEGKKN